MCCNKASVYYFQPLAPACACCPYGKLLLSVMLARFYCNCSRVGAEKNPLIDADSWLTLQTCTWSLHLCPPILPSTILHFLESFPQGVFAPFLAQYWEKKSTEENCCTTEYRLCVQGCWWKPLLCKRACACPTWSAAVAPRCVVVGCLQLLVWVTWCSRTEKLFQRGADWTCRSP